MTEKISPSEALARFTENPRAIEIIANHVSNGGTLVTLCEDMGISYPNLLGWIRESSERQFRYEESIKDRSEWGVEVILRELRAIAHSDIREVFNSDGSLRPIDEWPPHMGRIVSSVETDELFEGVGRDRKQIGITRKVKVWDKLRALELLGKNLRMFIERMEHNVERSLADILDESWRIQAELEAEEQKALAAGLSADPEKP